MMNTLFSYPVRFLWRHSSPPRSTTPDAQPVDIESPRSKPTRCIPIKPEHLQTTTTTTSNTASPQHRVLKRPRPKSPKSPPATNRSPLVRRIPSLLGEYEEFVSDEERSVRESTPRSKLLRRESHNVDTYNWSTREGTALSSVTYVLSEGDEEANSGIGGEQEFSLIRFTHQEAQLFLRIRNRGLEPLLPAHWEVDFSTMPGSLFFSEKGNQVGHIDSVSLEGTFQATNALQALVMLGSTVRGSMEGKRDPEDKVMTGLKKYIQWSLEDVKASNYKEYSEIYPRIVLVRSNGKGAEYCESRVRRKLNEVASEVRQEEARLAAAGVPRDDDTASSTLYGIAVSGAVVALLTLDARILGDNTVPRTMIILDFSDITLDFWNAIAVALLVIAAREDELARHAFYRAHDLKIVLPPAIGKKRGWELKSRRSATFDADADK
ncbi:hypothetical protein K440DRAFT_616341 [Wilcoxina mikolae CBS 423.85]|nr:hypothetical protein K440DRAFT_616341 [Wilcoxina mikolae CBS 423.85]